MHFYFLTGAVWMRWFSRQEPGHRLWGAHQHPQSKSGTASTYKYGYTSLLLSGSPRRSLTGASVCLCFSLSWWPSCSSSRETCPLWPMGAFAQENEPPESTGWRWASRWALTVPYLVQLCNRFPSLDWQFLLLLFGSVLLLGSSVSPCRCWWTPSTAQHLTTSAASSPTTSRKLFCMNEKKSCRCYCLFVCLFWNKYLIWLCWFVRFDPHRTVQQLRACGVLETIRISAAGYPTRSPHLRPSAKLSYRQLK